MGRRLPLCTSYMSIIFCITVLVLALSACGSSQEPVTCEAGQFAAGQTASVTCNFHRQMKDSRYHIFVLRYPFNKSANFAGTDILKCSRLNTKTPLCDVADGYRFSGNISDRLTLTIPEVKEVHVGQYVCQVVPTDGMPINVCRLTLNGTVTIATTADPSQSDFDRKSHRETECIFYIESHVYFIIIFLAVVSITLLCTNVILAVSMLKMREDLILYRKKNKKRHKDTTRSDAHNGSIFDADSESASMVSRTVFKRSESD